MKMSVQLSAMVQDKNLVELAIFQLAGREIALERQKTGVGIDAPFSEEEYAFLMEVTAAVLSAPSDYPRTPHLPPETIVWNGIRSKFNGIEEGFWT